MTIIGIGIDILDIRRIDRLLQKFPIRFKNKIFAEEEIDSCMKRKGYISSFAKIFALKEATIKAISNTHNLKWLDIKISNDNNGKPLVNLSGYALKNVQSKADKFAISASVSDEKNYAVAFVIIEKT
ncbi:MAG: holo-ACP synthase [Holosporales bacterium]|nr:holo-ACP synthase [Holosporales bacterium]